MTGPLHPSPDDASSARCSAEGFGLVAGVDEVGRGAGPGPPSVGVVVFRPDAPPPEGFRDSKRFPRTPGGPLSLGDRMGRGLGGGTCGTGSSAIGWG